MRIEELNKSHLKACSLIYIKTFNEEPWNDKWDENTAYKRLEDIMNTPGFVGMVALEGEFIKGAIFGNLESWFEGYMYNLKEMFVTKEDKGTGIGSQLFQALESELTKHGASSITLFTSKGDLTEKFYKKNGCTAEDDMLMMGKEL